MNAAKVSVILNLLGEHYDDPAKARADADAYRTLVGAIGEADVDACLSIKPSQIGLDISVELFRELLCNIVTEAAANDVFVWIDMEDAKTTDDTLDVFTDLAATHPWSLGQCLQSNLKRTQADLERVVDVSGKVRLVKGAYDEGPQISYTKKSQVDEAYRENIEYLFANRDRGIAVGSHDMEMIELASDLGLRTGADYEIQMLMGVRDELQSDLAADGVTMWQYAPYGDKWLSYFYRRVRERKENALFALRAIIGN